MGDQANDNFRLIARAGVLAAAPAGQYGLSLALDHRPYPLGAAGAVVSGIRCTAWSEGPLHYPCAKRRARVTTLRDVIQAVRPQHVIGLADGPVDAVACHPANVAGHHVLFGCMDEYLEYNRWQTWQTHLDALPGMPLAAVMTPASIPGLNVPQLIVAEPRKALGRASRVVTGCPDEGMVLYGITGTNGKTTTAHLIG